MSEAGVKVSSLLVVLQKCTGRPPGGSAVLLIEVADQFNQKVCEKYVLTIFNQMNTRNFWTISQSWSPPWLWPPFLSEKSRAAFGYVCGRDWASRTPRPPRSSGAPARRFEGEKLPCPLSAGHTLGDGDFTSYVTAASKLEEAKIYSLHFSWAWERPWRYGEPGWGIGTQQVEGRRRRRKQESERC